MISFRSSSILSEVPEALQRVARLFQKKNHQLFLVGGALRDILLKRETTDWDLATDASLEEIEALLPCTVPIGREYGTLLLLIEGLVVHITSFKGESLEEDLGHRDFTINSMAYDIQNERLYDPYRGRRDLRKGLLRGIDPKRRYREDPLRMLRLFRFVGELGFHVEKTTCKEMNPSLLTRVKSERILEEMNLLLLSPYVEKGLLGLFETGLLYTFMPAFTSLRGEEKILLHIRKATSIIRPLLPLRWAALLHDLGKGETKSIDELGVHFYGHDRLSTELGDTIMTELRLPVKMKKKILLLVRHHMFSMDPKMSHRALSRLIRRVGRENIGDLLELRRADIMATTGRFDLAWERFYHFSQRIEDLLEENEPFSLKDLAISGKDVMEVLGVDQGPKVGQILEEAFAWVTEERGRNTREDLLAYLQER